MSNCFYSIGNLLRQWKVHCQWPSDTHSIDPDSDELLDSLVEANDILLEQVVSASVVEHWLFVKQCYIENNTWARGDMKFILECST